jgi:hypothetical protein
LFDHVALQERREEVAVPLEPNPTVIRAAPRGHDAVELGDLCLGALGRLRTLCQ